MLSDLIVKPLGEPPGGSVDETLVSIHQPPLDLQHDRAAHRNDLLNGTVSGLGGTEMPNHLCALLEDRFEKVGREFLFSSFADLASDCAPHVGDKNNVLQRMFATKLAEHPEIPSGNSSEPPVGEAMDVDGSRKHKSFLVSVMRFSLVDPEEMSVDVDLRGGQESCNHLQDLRVTL